MEKELTGYPSIDKPWLKYFSEEDKNYTYSECSMYEYLLNETKDFGDLIAIEYYGVKISYKKLKKNIEKVASALYEYGVKQGEIVSICLPNIPEVVYVFYAINKIGAVSNFIDPRSGEEDLKIALNDANSKLLISLDSVLNKFVSICNDTELKLIISVDAVNSLPLPIKVAMKSKVEVKDTTDNKIIEDWNIFIKKHYKNTEINTVPYIKDAYSVIAYTGGTTGTPKGVIMTDYALNATVTMSRRAHYNMSLGDRALDIAPPWTYYGLNNCIHTFLCFGITTILVPKVEPDELGELISKFKPNQIITVPSALNAVMGCKKLLKKLDFVKEIIVGADKLNEKLETDFNSFLKENGSKAKLSKGYGMTEVGAGAAFSKSNCNTVGNDGIPYIGNIIAAFNEVENNYIECKFDEVGEIAISGPSIMVGYFGRYSNITNEVKKHHSDGTIWAHSGDLGYIDADGKVHIVGRLKRMFVKNGFKIFAPAVESAIMSYSGIDKAVVVPIEDEDNGCIAKAYLVLYKDANSKEIVENLKEYLKSKLYDYEIPDLYELIDELPLTGMGKVDYKNLEMR